MNLENYRLGQNNNIKNKIDFGFIDDNLNGQEYYYRKSSLKSTSLKKSGLVWEIVVYRLEKSIKHIGKFEAKDICLLEEIHDVDILINILFKHFLCKEYSQLRIRNLIRAFDNAKFNLDSFHKAMIKEFENLKLKETPHDNLGYRRNATFAINSQIKPFFKFLRHADKNNYSEYLIRFKDIYGPLWYDQYILAEGLNFKSDKEHIYDRIANDDFWRDMVRGPGKSLDYIFYHEISSRTRIEIYLQLSNHKFKKDETRKKVFDLFKEYSKKDRDIEYCEMLFNDKKYEILYEFIFNSVPLMTRIEIYGIIGLKNEFMLANKERVDMDQLEGIRFKEKLKEKELIKRKKEINNDDNSYEQESNDWEMDYFNTMTDGQLGDWEDFKGDIDDIDTWARG